MISMTRKLALVAGIGLALASVSYTPSASAQVAIGVNVGIPVAPPPPRVEVIPAARPGWVWMHGHWAWDPAARQHVWVPGHWVHDQVGIGTKAFGCRHAVAGTGTKVTGAANPEPLRST
jgi:hypothetical protein